MITNTNQACFAKAAGSTLQEVLFGYSIKSKDFIDKPDEKSMLKLRFNVSGTATVMIGWTTVKMAANWLIAIKDEKEQWKRQMAFSALLGNMISFFIALVGGLIWSVGVQKLKN